MNCKQDNTIKRKKKKKERKKERKEIADNMDNVNKYKNLMHYLCAI